MAYVKRDGFTFNPFVHPTVLPNGRVFIPTGEPIVIRRGEIASNPIEKIKGGFPSFFQVMIARVVSHDFGDVPTGHVFSVKQFSDKFKEIRRAQIPIDDIGATFIPQRGVFEGAPDEEGIQIIVYFSPVDGEETLGLFRKNMLMISQILTDVFAQKTTFANFYKKGIPDTAWKVTHS